MEDHITQSGQEPPSRSCHCLFVTTSSPVRTLYGVRTHVHTCIQKVVCVTHPAGLVQHSEVAARCAPLRLSIQYCTHQNLSLFNFIVSPPGASPTCNQQTTLATSACYTLRSTFGPFVCAFCRVSCFALRFASVCWREIESQHQPLSLSIYKVRYQTSPRLISCPYLLASLLVISTPLLLVFGICSFWNTPWLLCGLQSTY